MTKRQDLCLQRRSRSEQSDQRQPNQAANISHQPRASPDSTALTSRIEFPTMTTDFNREITRDYFYTANRHWLEVYHVDGFRYDCVPNYWDGPLGVGYASIVYETYQLAKTKVASGN